MTDHIDLDQLIQVGHSVLITDANGDKHDAIAKSNIERGRDMQIIWVELEDGTQIPWPAHYVELTHD